MRPLGTYRAAPRLPEALAPLTGLARDLRFTYRHEIRSLFRDLDPKAWEGVEGNPVAFLLEVDPERLAAFGGNDDYLGRLAAVTSALSEEDRAEPTLPEAAALSTNGDRIAYFCAEFGLSEVLPIYSGGLGVLAGDHLKSASDLRLPLWGVGLFYREGFFRQALTADSRQREVYPIVDPEDLPMDLLETSPDRQPAVSVRILDRDVYLLVRRVKVGRVTLLLLDSHLPINRPNDREITSRLYGGDIETRIKQEIVLGIGGIRALELAGFRPSVCHANEGHATFLGLERIRQLREEKGLSFDEAREVAASGNVFTTHTPVPAGIDLFPPELMKRYFAEKMEALGVPFERFLGLGRQVPEDPHEYFSMAVLGIRLATRVNGVSKLHSTVSRRLWRGLMPEAPLSEIPIHAVTNGVHAPTWTHPTIAELSVLQNPEGVDRAELWRRHERLRAGLVNDVRSRTASARHRRGAPDSEVASAWRILDEKALTICFARRFATYKRATLIFSDAARLVKILSGGRYSPPPGPPESSSEVVSRGVQLIFAGKAHPKDEAGKEFIRKVGEFALKPELRGRVVLLENYDMGLARLLVSGADVWLNNPRRPQEASGTSGMKAALNGVLNLSVLDGWWDEAPRDDAGFSIGDAESGRGDEEMAAALYDRLENEVVPLFYSRDDEGVPAGWLEKMVRSASTLGQLFSSDRMVTDYLLTSYLPAVERARGLSANDFQRAKALAAWRAGITERWQEVGFISVATSVTDPARLDAGESFVVEVRIRLGTLSTDEVDVDWFEGAVDQDGVVDAGFSMPLALTERVDGRATYTGTIVRPADDRRGYSVRLRPKHPDLSHANETGLVLWAG